MHLLLRSPWIFFCFPHICKLSKYRSYFHAECYQSHEFCESVLPSLCLLGKSCHLPLGTTSSGLHYVFSAMLRIIDYNSPRSLKAICAVHQLYLQDLPLICQPGLEFLGTSSYWHELTRHTSSERQHCNYLQWQKIHHVC